jgi:hypothetical protein
MSSFTRDRRSTAPNPGGPHLYHSRMPAIPATSRFAPALLLPFCRYFALKHARRLDRAGTLNYASSFFRYHQQFAPTTHSCVLDIVLLAVTLSNVPQPSLTHRDTPEKTQVLGASPIANTLYTPGSNEY